MKKKLSFFLQHLHGFWSVPLAFALFWVAGIILQGMFGDRVGTYDLSFIQPLFLSIAIVSGASAGALFLIRYNQKGFYQWLYGKKKADGSYERKADAAWEEITSWQKFKIYLFVYFFYVAAIIAVYKMLV